MSNQTKEPLHIFLPPLSKSKGLDESLKTFVRKLSEDKTSKMPTLLEWVINMPVCVTVNSSNQDIPLMNGTKGILKKIVFDPNDAPATHRTLLLIPSSPK
jgi:hypothetical protein